MPVLAYRVWRLARRRPMLQEHMRINLTTAIFNRNYDEAIKVMQRASAIPNKWKNISFHDEVRADRTLSFCLCTTFLSA